VSVGKPDGFSGSLAEKIELGTPFFAASDGPDVDDIGGMKREYPLDALVGYDSANGESFVDASAFACDDSAGKDLQAFLVAFFDSAVDVNGVAHFEMRNTFLKAFSFSSIEQFCFHPIFSFSRQLPMRKY
jgi:hypothetical protein